MQRTIKQVIQAQPSQDGDGVKIRRCAGFQLQQMFDPFLMLDEIASDEAADYIGGFPAHPHRGFETVTYMLDGRMRHRDHLCNEGLLEAGGVQWMTAGKGVIHSEMPEQEQGRLHGFQLWINLPAKDKLQPPRYQEFPAQQIPAVSLPGANVKIIAGRFHGQQGPVNNISTQASYFDVTLTEGAAIELPTAADNNVLIYLISGGISLGGQTLQQGWLAQLSDGDSVILSASSNSRLLFLSARPIGEPIAHWGPFVMNTHEEIQQAMDDYRAGKLTD